MYLLVNRAGKYWRWDYRIRNRRRTQALDVFPAVSLREARSRRDELKKLLASGVGVADVREAQRRMKVQLEADSFGEIARVACKVLAGVGAGSCREDHAAVGKGRFPLAW